MGVTLSDGTYVPDVGEVGWGDEEQNNLLLFHQRTHEQIRTTAGFADLTQQIVHDAEAIADGNGVWSATTGFTFAITAASWAANVVTYTRSGHGLAVGDKIVVTGSSPSGYNGTYILTAVTSTTFSAALGSNPGSWVSGSVYYSVTRDLVNKTTGTSSISAALKCPSGGGVEGKLYCDVTPVPVAGHTEVDVDVRWTKGSGAAVGGKFEVVFASGAGLTGTVITKSFPASVPTENVWATVSVPIGALTTIGSFGVRKRASSSGSTSEWITVKVDNARLSATSGIDSALAINPIALIIPPGFASAVPQGVKTMLATQAVLDFRPLYANQTRFRGEKSLRDSFLDETGTTDMTTALQAVLDSLQPGDTLTAPPTAVYRVDGSIDVDCKGVTLDMQRARIFASAYTGRTMFNVDGSDLLFRNWCVFGRSPLTITNGSSLTTVAGAPSISGSSMLLDAVNEEVRIPVIPGNSMTPRYARDEQGFIQFDIEASDTAHVPDDLVISVTPHTPEIDPFGNPVYDYQLTIPVLTATRTTYTVKFRPPNIMARTRLTIKKATASTNTITIYTVKAYRREVYASAVPGDPDADSTLNSAFNVSGSNLTFENTWCEGMGGDGFQIRGNHAHGLRISGYVGRAMGRECIEVSQGNDILIENFILAHSARQAIDIEPETDASAISNLRWRNGIIGSGGSGTGNTGMVCSGGDRSDHITFDDIWLRIDDNGVWTSDFVDGGAIRNVVYTWEGTDAVPHVMNINGDGMLIDHLDSDGAVRIGGNRATIGDMRIKNVDQTGTFVLTGTGHRIVGDIQVGDPEIPVTFDPTISVAPVQLPADYTLLGSITVPCLNEQLGNTYKSKVLTPAPSLLRGLDMNGNGLRELRGLSPSAIPANNLSGIVTGILAGATSAVVSFAPKTDHMNPANFNLQPSGPHIQKATADHQVLENSGNWQVYYNGVTSGKAITGAVYTPGSPWVSGDVGSASTNPFPRGTVTFQTSTPHDVLVGDDVGVIDTVSTGGLRTDSYDNGEFQGDAIVKPRTYVVTAVPDTTHFTVAYKNVKSGTAHYSSDPGTYVSGGTLGLGPDAKAAIAQRWLRALSTVQDTDVTVSGTGILTTTGLTFTWAASLGDLPETLFDCPSFIISWKSKVQKLTILVTTTMFGGFLTSGQYYVYRMAGRSFEGEPLAGLPAKALLLTAGTNAISVLPTGDLVNLTTDKRVTGVTVWRAGPFAANPGTYTGDYDRRVDLSGSREYHHPTGGTDRGATFSGFPWVTGAWTSAEVGSDQSGWERDTAYFPFVTCSWPAEPYIPLADIRKGGFTPRFGVPCPVGGGELRWGVMRLP